MIIQNLNLTLGMQVVFKNCNVKIDENSKVGVIGVNGAGKTTLFKTIIGDIDPDAGDIIMKKNTRIGYLPQTISFDESDKEITALDYIKEGRPIQKLQYDLRMLENEMAKPNVDNMDFLLLEYTKISDLLDFWEQYEADAVLDKIITGMNISPEILSIKIANMSGGEKSKIAFARLLYSKPNVLLLDEPTNHLDKQSRDWVIDYLKAYKGQVLIISHDYDFLNKVVDKILYIDKQKHDMSLFNGDYNKFKKVYNEIKLTNQRLVDKQEREEQKLIKVIETAEGGSVKRKRLAKSREKELEKLRQHKIEKMVDDKVADITLINDDEYNKIPLRITDLNFSYSHTPLLRKINLCLSAGERVLIAGKNGVGKSTLLKLIVNQLTPQNGEIKLGAKTKIAYYDQEQKEINSTDKTILDFFENQGFPQKHIRTVLSKYLFWGDQLLKPIKVLSPGEKCRLSFAKLSLTKSNLMLLDEPTNHLDFQTQEVIANNLNKYTGTILLVSHNPEFVEKLNITNMLLLPEGKMRYYNKEILKKIQSHNEK